jgi:hypothetical protein
MSARATTWSTNAILSPAELMHFLPAPAVVLSRLVVLSTTLVRITQSSDNT